MNLFKSLSLLSPVNSLRNSRHFNSLSANFIAMLQKNQFAFAIIFCFMLMPTLANAQEQTAVPEIPVLVQYQGQWQGYIERPRLNTVLQQQVKESNNIHWPSARLFSVEPSALLEIEAVRTQALEQLRLLIISNAARPVLAMQLQEMRMQISRWQLAKPILQPINPLMAQLDQSENPRLDAGQYLLLAGKRVGTVKVFGLGGERFFRHEQLKPAYQYVLDALSTEQSVPDEVAIISGLKPARLIPVASWNRTESALSTGDSLFIPLDRQLVADDYPELNQQLQMLLAHRVPL